MFRKSFIYILVLLSFILGSCTPAATLTPTEAPPAAVPTDLPALPPTEAPPPTEPPAPAATEGPTPMPTADRSNPKEVILATTTSTRDSGLLDVLIPVFEELTGYTVKSIAVGSGQAMQMGKEGNADVLLVHAPASENEFMDGGFGTEDLLVMHNDFIFVGPADDPAKIKGLKTAVEALKLIAEAQGTFVSRGDDSGTHKKEKELWKKAEITPTKDDAWYLESGGSMGDTLRIASEKYGYTLSDRATYLAQKETLALDILVEGDKSLLNIYSVIPVNPEKFPLVNKEGGKAFADFMVSPETQILINEFGKEKFGQSLYIPDAGKNESDLGK
jgi:tungstate transport system substrate-binding protein